MKTCFALWSDFKKNLLITRSNSPIFKSYIDNIHFNSIEEKDGEVYITLKAPSLLHQSWAEKNVTKSLLTEFEDFYKKPCSVGFETSQLTLPYRKVEAPQTIKKVSEGYFNSSYTFLDFITGTQNVLAYEAAKAVSTGKNSFNPLFICGPSGLGKTHLLQAIAQETLKRNPRKKIFYLSAERFLNECIQSIQNKKMAMFQKKYRKDPEMLLLDDIQMIARGQRVQEEFFYTFNQLQENGIPVVVCSDKLPHQILGLEDRIKTRLDGGLVVDVSYPDLETRIAILKNKSLKKGIILSQETLLKIATTCCRSIREIEGVLNKIKMIGDLKGSDVCEKEIENILGKLATTDISVSDIQRKVAEKFNLSVEELCSTSRIKNTVIARQTAMFLIKHRFKKSLNDVGRIFGGKDHTTVLNSLRKVEALTKKDPEFKRILQKLKNEIHYEY